MRSVAFEGEAWKHYSPDTTPSVPKVGTVVQEVNSGGGEGWDIRRSMAFIPLKSAGDRYPSVKCRRVGL